MVKPLQKIQTQHFRDRPPVGMFQDRQPQFHRLPVLAVATVVVSIAAIVVYLWRCRASLLSRPASGLQGRWKVLQDLSTAQAPVLLQLCQFLGVQSIGIGWRRGILFETTSDQCRPQHQNGIGLQSQRLSTRHCMPLAGFLPAVFFF